MLFGVIDICFSSTPHLLTSETMVHHDRVRWYHMACGGSFCVQNVVSNNVGPITWQHHTTYWRRLKWEGSAQSPAHQLVLPTKKSDGTEKFATTGSVDGCSVLPETLFVGNRKAWTPHGFYLAIQPHLPDCQLYRWQVGPNMWSSTTIKSLDPVVVTALGVGCPGENYGPSTGGLSCNCRMPGVKNGDVKAKNVSKTRRLTMHILSLLTNFTKPS